MPRDEVDRAGEQHAREVGLDPERPECDGSGMVDDDARTGLAVPCNPDLDPPGCRKCRPCERCGGTGEVRATPTTCGRCHGTGIQPSGKEGERIGCASCGRPVDDDHAPDCEFTGVIREYQCERLTPDPPAEQPEPDSRCVCGTEAALDPDGFGSWCPVHGGDEQPPPAAEQPGTEEGKDAAPCPEKYPEDKRICVYWAGHEGVHSWQEGRGKDAAPAPEICGCKTPDDCHASNPPEGWCRLGMVGGSPAPSDGGGPYEARCGDEWHDSQVQVWTLKDGRFEPDDDGEWVRVEVHAAAIAEAEGRSSNDSAVPSPAAPEGERRLTLHFDGPGPYAIWTKAFVEGDVSGLSNPTEVVVPASPPTEGRDWERKYADLLCAFGEQAEGREALRNLTEKAEATWPLLREPETTRAGIAQAGARLRRAAEKARAALSTTDGGESE